MMKNAACACAHRGPGEPASGTTRLAGVARRAFTLIELIVVMGIIIVLIGITIVSVGAIARDSQLATGTNRVKAALGQARALAMQKRKPVGVVFRAKWNPNEPDVEQLTEVLIVEWSGSASLVQARVVNRLVASPTIEPTYLPARIKVAAQSPAILRNGTSYWVSQPNFLRSRPSIGPLEAPSFMFGVLFDKDGSLITQIPESDALAHWVDFDQLRDQNGFWMQNTGQTFNNQFFAYDEPDDEVVLAWAGILAVYDDEEAREFAVDINLWSDEATRDQELSAYIDQHANKLYFNRYTGVVMR